MLAMTYMYHGERDFGLELARRGMYGMICKQGLSWALPCFTRADTGEANLPASGTDYYQMMMLWSLPAAIEGKDLSEPCAEGGLVDRVLKAAEK